MTVSERTEFRELEESVKQMTFTQKRIETGLKHIRPDEINKQISEIKQTLTDLETKEHAYHERDAIRLDLDNTITKLDSLAKELESFKEDTEEEISILRKREQNISS